MRAQDAWNMREPRFDVYEEVDNTQKYKILPVGFILKVSKRRMTKLNIECQIDRLCVCDEKTSRKHKMRKSSVTLGVGVPGFSKTF